MCLKLLQGEDRASVEVVWAQIEKELLTVKERQPGRVCLESRNRCLSAGSLAKAWPSQPHIRSK